MFKTFYLATNKNPEQISRDRIDFALEQSGWVIQDKKKLNLGTATESPSENTKLTQDQQIISYLTGTSWCN